MGRVQKLRRTVRAELVAYAERHPDDFDAHMTAAASLWLLAGRQGLLGPQQFALAHQAQETVARLSVGRPSRALGRAQRQLDELVELLWERTQPHHADTVFMEHFAEDFAEWTLEFLEEQGGGESA